MESGNRHGQGPHQSQNQLHQIGHHHRPEPTGDGVHQHQARHKRE